MTEHNATNERMKRKYFAYLKEAKRYSEATVDATAKALDRFETYTKYRDFRAFHFEQAIAFKRHLAEQKAMRSKKGLSKATLHSTLTQLKRFFQWLSEKPGYKSRFRYSDAEYFNLSEKDARIATTQNHYIKTASPDAIAAMRQFSEALLCSTCAPDDPKGTVQ